MAPTATIPSSAAADVPPVGAVVRVSEPGPARRSPNPPRWCPDPDQPARQRWWAGTAWAPDVRTTLPTGRRMAWTDPPRTTIPPMPPVDHRSRWLAVSAIALLVGNLLLFFGVMLPLTGPVAAVLAALSYGWATTETDRRWAIGALVALAVAVVLFVLCIPIFTAIERGL